MDTSQKRTLTAAAERRIAAVLAELEVATDAYVDQVSVRAEDIKVLASGSQQWIRRVEITLRPAPGARWDI